MTAPRPAGEAVAALSRLPGIREGVEEAREACTALRWHPALRRRIPESAAESRVRGAHATAELEGVTRPLAHVRELVLGLRPWPAELDPVERVLHGAIAATTESEHVGHFVIHAPLQALARLHAVAASGLVRPDALGRPRTHDEVCRELTDLGPAPPAAVARERLASAVGELAAMGTEVPAVVVAAVVHAEIASARPFLAGNALVARAFDRAVVRASGLDPTGVAVTEWGHASGGATAYLGALVAYHRGDLDGVSLWIRQCCTAMVQAAEAGTRVADDVLAGRFSGGLAVPPQEE